MINMDETDTEEYNEEEAENFALALGEKAELQAISDGLSLSEAKKQGQEKYEEVRKRHALEFLKKMEDKLNSLSDQSIAQLLRILIALGLDIEDEEELEAWINKLTHESLNRIALYFNQRDNISLLQQLKTQPNPQKLLDNLRNYSPQEIEALSSMVKSLSVLNKKRTKNDVSRSQRDDILKKINNTLKKDIKLKKQAYQQKRGQKRNQDRVDPKDILISKMTTEGIESGGRYWNEVLGEFNRSDNKMSFAISWQIDKDRHNELDIKPINDKQREDERALAENKEHQKQIEENKRKQQEQEDIRQQEKQLELMLKKQEQARQQEEERKKKERDKILEKRGLKEEEKKSQNSNNINQNTNVGRNFGRGSNIR